MLQKTVSYLFTFIFVLSCASGSHIAKKPPLSASAASTVPITDKTLTDEIIQFLALTKSHRPQEYENRRRALQQRLQQYLAARQLDRPLTVELQRDGLTFLLPVQFIDLDNTKNADENRMANSYELVVSELKGEVLDLFWHPGKKGLENRLVVLFADSLLVLTLPEKKAPAVNTILFPQQSYRRIRSAFPTGIFIQQMSRRGSEEKAILSTSSLDSPLIFDFQKNRLRTAKSGDLHPGDLSPTSWYLPKGRDVYYFRNNDLEPFRSFRMLPDSKTKILLNFDGYLKLFTDDVRYPAWVSERPWGSRLFLLNSERIAVCDDRQSSFVVFQMQRQKRTLSGQSPQFPGAVSAITSAKFRGKDGLIVSSRTNATKRSPVTNLYFISNESLHWTLPVRYDRPGFPDYNASLAFIFDKNSWYEKSSGCSDIPTFVASQLYETLFTRDGDGKIEPQLATSARPDSNEKIWDIRLRKHILFSDGSVLTTEKVRKSWENSWRRCRHNRYCTDDWLWRNISGADEFIAGEADSIAGLQIIDANTLRIQLLQANPDFIEILTHPCFSIREKSTAQKPPIGTGPFQLDVSTITNDLAFFSCSRNEFYHEGQPLLQHLNVMFKPVNVIESLTNLNTAGTFLRDKNDLAYFRAVKTTRVLPLPTAPLYFMAMNPAKPPFDDPVLRQYIAQVILNRKELADIITVAECTPAVTFFVPGNVTLPPAPPGLSLSVNRKLHIGFRGSDPVARQIAERLRARMAQSNIPVEISANLADTTFSSMRINGNYDILIDSVTPAFRSPLNNLRLLLNHGYAKTPAIANFLGKMQASTSENKAVFIGSELIRKAWLTPVLTVKNYAVLPATLQNVSATAGPALNLAKAWLPK